MARKPQCGVFTWGVERWKVHCDDAELERVRSGDPRSIRVCWWNDTW